VTGKARTSTHLFRVMNRLALGAARKVEPSVAFTAQPEPRSIGLYTRGKELVAGSLFFSGHHVEAPGVMLWDIKTPDPAFAAQAHGFGWLDDLAALGTTPARSLAQSWTAGWIDRFGKGAGIGWAPDLTGRRVLRWIHQVAFLVNRGDPAASTAYFACLSVQAEFLSRRWKAAQPGLPRFEALAGLIYAGAFLAGKKRLMTRGVAGLAAECRARIDKSGSLASRNPEDLLEVLTLLTWITWVLADMDTRIPPDITAAIERIAPVLRALRHADGGLARFHGGGRGLEGRLDQALAASGPKQARALTMAMGFARLNGRRSSVIVDAAPPPDGQARFVGHASTTAFELTSGRRPLIVNCGAGTLFGADWEKVSRETLSHSALTLDETSSSLFDKQGDALSRGARISDLRFSASPDESEIYLAHDGWVASHGLTANRRLTLSHDGRHVSGVDALSALYPRDRKKLEALLEKTPGRAIGYTVHFHLHPDVSVAVDETGTQVYLTLRSGEIWVLTHKGPAQVAIRRSAYLEKGRLTPQSSIQVVLSGHARGFETRIGWTLAKAQDTPLAIRDLSWNDLPASA
jgi:uncharacterized heparinase superfamily protein